LVNYLAIALVAAAIAAGIGYNIGRAIKRGSPRFLAGTVGLLATCVVFVGSVIAERIVQESVWRHAQPQMNGMTPMVGPDRAVTLLFVIFAAAGYILGWIYAERYSKRKAETR